MRRRFFYLSPGILLGILVLIGAPWPAALRGSGAFTPFVAQTRPQRAAADFDADGRQDEAFIQDSQGGSEVRLTLSGSPAAITFVVNAVSVVASDIDHDGDTDLVMATPSNQIAIWINDGHGHFTEVRSLPSRNLSSATIVLHSSQEEPAALCPPAPLVVGPGRRRETSVVGTRVRPPTDPLIVALAVLVLPSLRAPPLGTILN
jgi:hypothetical protein